MVAHPAGAPSHDSDEIYRTLLEQNPWRTEGRVPQVLARTRERPLAAVLWRRLTSDRIRRFQLVLGPRRVGKTTALYQTVRHLINAGVEPRRLWWISVDHPRFMQVELGALVRLVLSRSDATREHPAHLFLDELVYASQWDRWLKTIYDEKWPVRIAASSSSSAALRSRLVESGVGRWEEQYLSPYGFTEYLHLLKTQRSVPASGTLAEAIRDLGAIALDRKAIADHRRLFLLTGGFPELLLAGTDSGLDEQSRVLESQRTLRYDAIERAIYKDIPQAYGVENPMTLERLIYILADQVASLLSPSAICQSLQRLTVPTFEKYLGYLERSFLVFTLTNYGGAERSKQRRGRKLYFVDGALRNAALQRGLTPLDDAGEMGLLFENAAASHLHALSQQTQIRLYHWRDQNREVDLIYDHPEEPIAFEIAHSMGHHRHGLRALIKQFPKFRGRAYIVAPNSEYVDPHMSSEGIGSLPLDHLLLASGGLAEQTLKQRLGSHDIA